MCGLAGIYNNKNDDFTTEIILKNMVNAINYRGPDNLSTYINKNVALGHARLSIIDLFTGNQPVFNEDKTVCVVFTGEIFNYIELKNELTKSGHTFYTKTDTEVIVHLYEEHGRRFVEYLNGQFAIALWDEKKNEVILARDRYGIRPLYYYMSGNTLYFASEIKSLLEVPEISAELNPSSIIETFSYWSNLPGNTFFKGIKSLSPGNILIASNHTYDIHQYWDWSYEKQDDINYCNFDEVLEELELKFKKAIKLQLRSDVPVGVYISGGLDSTIVANLAAEESKHHLNTFSIRFDEKEMDEGNYQDIVTKNLHTNHHVLNCGVKDISSAFPDCVRHLETPILRTAPVPLYLLSNLVNRNNIKVVLSGEGADEIFCGYDIFKELIIRKHYLKKKNLDIVKALLFRIYHYINASPVSNSDFSATYFSDSIDNISAKYLTHTTRWKTTAKLHKFLIKEITQNLEDGHIYSAITPHLPEGIDNWDALNSGQYIESTTLLSNYLLNCQGDRVSMAHSVEGRYPFLDNELVDFANKLPNNFKILGFKEKHVLKKAMQKYVPERIIKRVKQPYRAPDIDSFISNGQAPDYVDYLFSKDRLMESGIFNYTSVSKFYEKCLKRKTISFVDNMAFVGILSTMVLDEIFIKKRTLT